MLLRSCAVGIQGFGAAPLPLAVLANGYRDACVCQLLRLSLAGEVICSTDKCLAQYLQTRRQRSGRCRVGS